MQKESPIEGHHICSCYAIKIPQVSQKNFRRTETANSLAHNINRGPIGIFLKYIRVLTTVKI